jgi:uncharacterized membrane protein
MNLKFIDDILKTIEVMKTGLYYLSLLIGVHTVTFTAYFVYKYLNNNNNNNNNNNDNNDNDNNDNDNNDNDDNKIEVKKDDNLLLRLFNIESTGSDIQMEELMNSLEKKHIYKSLLEQKKEELSNLIIQLDTVYNNIGLIREKLEELNTKST